jgi:hypothetical protein
MNFNTLLEQIQFNPNAAAWWISPKGEILPILGKDTHINNVIKNPQVFGYTIESIQKIYDKYHENIGTEKQAREEIMKHIMDNGWIRIRDNTNFYSIQTGNLSSSKDYIFDWACQMKDWVSETVEIIINNDRYTIGDIIKGKLFESITRKKLVYINSVFDFKI